MSTVKFALALMADEIDRELAAHAARVDRHPGIFGASYISLDASVLERLLRIARAALETASE